MITVLKHYFMPAVLLLATLNPAIAVAQTCTITSVHDGDSMRVRCAGQKKTTAIRLDQIDAPELEQAHGIASRDHLRSICRVGKPATIENRGKDRYQRTLGTVSCDGIDANAAMVKSGNAWVYDSYVEDKALYTSQEKAKTARAGLWQKRDAIPPWEFRRKRAKK